MAGAAGAGVAGGGPACSGVGVCRAATPCAYEAHCDAGACPASKPKAQNTQCFHSDATDGLCDGSGACGPPLYACAADAPPYCQCLPNPIAGCDAAHPYLWDCQGQSPSGLKLYAAAPGQGCVQGPLNPGYGYEQCCVKGGP